MNNGTWGHLKPRDLEELRFMPLMMKKESAKRGEANRLRLIDEYKKSPASVAAETREKAKYHHPLFYHERSR